MSYKTIMTVVDTNVTDKDLTATLKLAHAAGSHLAVLVVAITPPPPVVDYGAVVLPGSWQADIQKGAQELGETAAAIEKRMQIESVAGDVTTAQCDVALIESVVAKRAMVCDLAYLTGAPTDSVAAAQALSGILFRSPIAVILDPAHEFLSLRPSRVFVAWKPGREAAAAVHRALPILRQAEEVVVGIFDPVMTEHDDGEEPGADCAAWLSRQGCTVTVQQYPSGGRPVGECIAQRATEFGAGLVVMGAYGHSRWRQMIFGGTTRMMTEKAGVPVLLAH